LGGEAVKRKGWLMIWHLRSSWSLRSCAKSKLLHGVSGSFDYIHLFSICLH